MTEQTTRAAIIGCAVAAAVVAVCLIWAVLTGPDATTGPPTTAPATVTETTTATTVTTTATVTFTHATSCPPSPSVDY